MPRRTFLLPLLLLLPLIIAAVILLAVYGGQLTDLVQTGLKAVLLA